MNCMCNNSIINTTYVINLLGSIIDKRIWKWGYIIDTMTKLVIGIYVCRNTYISWRLFETENRWGNCRWVLHKSPCSLRSTVENCWTKAQWGELLLPNTCNHRTSYYSISFKPEMINKMIVCTTLAEKVHDSKNLVLQWNLLSSSQDPRQYDRLGDTSYIDRLTAAQLHLCQQTQSC